MDPKCGWQMTLLHTLRLPTVHLTAIQASWLWFVYIADRRRARQMRSCLSPVWQIFRLLPISIMYPSHRYPDIFSLICWYSWWCWGYPCFCLIQNDSPVLFASYVVFFIHCQAFYSVRFVAAAFLQWHLQNISNFWSILRYQYWCICSISQFSIISFSLVGSLLLQ